ncbi:MAG TPA: methionine synthase, partial [Dehalococcoidia bacterium]
MRRSEGRFLTTHTGSLIRPPELIEFANRQRAREPYDGRAYEETLRAAVADVVRKQVDVGLDVVNDGEFGKS